MSTMTSRFISKPRGLLAALFLSVALPLAGCAGGSSSTGSPAPATPAAITGIVKGGPFPVQGAAITLYATQSNGYGGAALSLATTTSASDGTFSFASVSNCPSGQQAYITAAGGAIGANASNPNAILMTAIGPCSSLVTGTYITIDGPTTVASAYALGNFISITGNVVNISAPANNNAATGSCTGTGSAMSCVAAGLPHAFLNALMLVNGVGTTTSLPSGAPNANPPQNPGTTDLIASLGTTANPYTLGNTIPVPLLNTLSNIMQDCVNTTGGTSGDGSNCGTFFLNTTPSSAYSASTAAPTNTLQAVMNMARFPASNISALYALASANNYYQPALTGVPLDFSVIVQYHSIAVNSAVVPLGTPFRLVLDANDNVYVTGNSAGASTGAAGAVPVIVSQLTSNGAGNWQTSLPNSTLCATGLTGNLCNAAVDSLGNLYLADSGYFYQVSSTGAATAFSLAPNATTTLKPLDVAVDRYDNVFVSSNNTTGTTNLVTYPAGSTGTTLPVAVTAAGAAQLLSPIPGGLGFNSNGDLGITQYGSASMRSVVLPNTSTTSTVFGAAQKGILSTSTDTQMEPVVFDANNNLFTVNLTNLFELPSTLYTGTATAITGSGGSQMRLAAIDGSGTIWIADATTGGGYIRSYYSTLPTPSFSGFAGCLPWGTSSSTATATSTVTTSTASTLCNPAVWAGSSVTQRPLRGVRNLVIDSSGSIWAGAQSNFALAQVIGSAAPTWPLLSYAKFGVQPQ